LGCATSTTNQAKETRNEHQQPICTGRLTKDPELKTLPSGTNVCELRLAVDGMGRGREVGYINVSVFGNSAEAAAKYLTKGWLVAVDGRLEYGEWEIDGAKRHDYSVVGNVEFLTAPRPAEEEPKSARKKKEPVAA
jgi:single-strand DNA-binding protein